MHNSPTYLAKVSIHIILISQFNHNLNTKKKKKKKECTLVNKTHIHNNNNATVSYSWCDGHSISINTCEACEAKFKSLEGSFTHIYT